MARHVSHRTTAYPGKAVNNPGPWASGGSPGRRPEAAAPGADLGPDGTPASPARPVPGLHQHARVVLCRGDVCVPGSHPCGRRRRPRQPVPSLWLVSGGIVMGSPATGRWPQMARGTNRAGGWPGDRRRPGGISCVWPAGAQLTPCPQPAGAEGAPRVHVCRPLPAARGHPPGSSRCGPGPRIPGPALDSPAVPRTPRPGWTPSRSPSVEQRGQSPGLSCLALGLRRHPWGPRPLTLQLASPSARSGGGVRPPGSAGVRSSARAHLDPTCLPAAGGGPCSTGRPRARQAPLPRAQLQGRAPELPAEAAASLTLLPGRFADHV